MIKYDEFVKAPNVELEYTVDELKELYKCSKDFLHFCNYVKVLHPDRGRVVFHPRDYQIRLINLILNNRYVIAATARQVGKTTTVGAYALWFAMFHEDKYVGIGSNNAKSAQDFLSRVKLMYEELPSFLKPGAKTYNEFTLLFENGSKIQTSATSKNAFRGRTPNLLILDEFAHLISDKIADEFYASNFPAISESKESKLIIISTPRGMFNLFGRLWHASVENKNSFKSIRVSWEEVPGRDERWKNEQLANSTREQFRQEQCLGKNTKICINNIKTNIIEEITVEELYARMQAETR